MSKWSAAERIFCEFQRHRKGVAFVSSLPAVHSLFPPTIPRWSLGVHRRTPLITHQVFIVFISLWVYAHAQWNCNVFIDSFMFFFSHFCFFFRPQNSNLYGPFLTDLWIMKRDLVWWQLSRHLSIFLVFSFVSSVNAVPVLFEFWHSKESVLSGMGPPLVSLPSAYSNLPLCQHIPFLCLFAIFPLGSPGVW